MIAKQKILFLCNHNSCRSQMAEAWTRHLKGDLFAVYSAGVEPREVDPRTIKAMSEVGIDITEQTSKDIGTFGDLEFDYVITLCDQASEACPLFPAKTRIMHRCFDAPPKIAANAKDEEEAMSPYHRVCDEIKAFVEELPGELDRGVSHN